MSYGLVCANINECVWDIDKKACKKSAVHATDPRFKSAFDAINCAVAAIAANYIPPSDCINWISCS